MRVTLNSVYSLFEYMSSPETPLSTGLDHSSAAPGGFYYGE